jgi:four helix bundle protein
MVKNFKSLEIWQRSRQLVKTIYILLETFPSDERFGLVSQLKKATISVPSNISEGCEGEQIKI